MGKSIFDTKGQSLVELLVGIALGTLIVGSAIGALILTLNINVQSHASDVATTLAREMIDSVRSVTEGKWVKIYNLPAKGSATHYYLISPKSLTGTVAVTNGSATVSGTGTTFDTELAAGDYITIESHTLQVQSVDDAVTLTLEQVYSGVDAAGVVGYREFSARSGDEPAIAVGGMDFTRYFTVENVNRDNCGRNAITTNAETGCFDNPTDVVEDPLTQKITVVVLWQKQAGDTTNITIEEYLTRSKNENAHFTDWKGGLRVPATTPVTQPDTMYVSMSGLSVSSTDGSLRLTSESGSISTGPNIDATDRWAWNDLRGWIDMREVNTIEVTDSRVYGYAAFDGTTDTIAFDCSTSPNGDVCDVPAGTGNWGAGNDAAGDLFGYAWSDSIGWISLNCDQTSIGGGNNCSGAGGVDYGVTIDTATGDFHGWAWNDVVGWISFNSANCDANTNGFIDVSCGGDDATTPAIAFKTNTAWRPGAAISGDLVSSTFDTGSLDGVTFSSIMWNGALGVGSSSVRFQFASSNDLNGEGGTWTYVGPDGTDATYYYPTGAGLPSPVVSAQHTGKRYFRYKIYLSRGESGTTPRVDDVVITWHP